MTEFKYARNPRFVGSWAPAVGKLVLNFGLLEFETHLWLLQMQARPEICPSLGFAQRVTKITDLVSHKAHSDEWMAAASEAWAKVATLALLRNGLAHSPLMFAWSDSSEQGDPGWIAVVDVRKLAAGREEAEAQISLRQIAFATDAAAALVVTLAELRTVWCSARDARLPDGGE